MRTERRHGDVMEFVNAPVRCRTFQNAPFAEAGPPSGPAPALQLESVALLPRDTRIDSKRYAPRQDPPHVARSGTMHRAEHVSAGLQPARADTGVRTDES